ncbi:MAG: ATP-binding protein [Salinibacter sp.]
MTQPDSSESSSSSSAPPTDSSLTGAQQIVDTLHEPLLVLDRDLTVQRVNPAFYRAFETTEEETIGRPLFEIGGGHFDHPALRDPLGTLLRAHEPFEEVELKGTFEGLGQRVLQVNGHLLQAGGETSEQILLAINDVTEQRQLEATLRQRARELEQSNEDLEQFAYAASHDLQEPLRMVSSYLQLLERRYKDELDETAQEFIDYAVDGAERMKALINGLLQYSRVGRKEGAFGEVDLDSVLEGILDDLARRIDELDATVEREPLPSTYGNRDQLRRLLQNLLENALTYHGDAPPSIHVSGETTDDGVHLVVRDEGPGIPPEAQEKVFQIFNQLDPHGAGQEGSGMGLALCKKIAERHDGRIWVEPEPGEGSAFHVTLRLSSSDTSDSNS